MICSSASTYTFSGLPATGLLPESPHGRKIPHFVTNDSAVEDALAYACKISAGANNNYSDKEVIMKLFLTEEVIMKLLRAKEVIIIMS